MEQDIATQWINSLIQLIKIGQANDLLDENGGFDLCVSSDVEKISMTFKVEPTNIIQLPKKEKRI